MATTKEIKIDISGDMTIYEAAEIKQLFQNAIEKQANISISLANVSEIDSSGIQLMVSLKKAATDTDKTVSYHSHSPAVVALLDLFDMTSYFGDPIVMEK
ncbi:MAG: STAS domain-containing protein [Gammaproteobacteria bacterium]|nr:STAS domain-containing protein [Gammaproteobacteria bacterium]